MLWWWWTFISVQNANGAFCMLRLSELDFAGLDCRNLTSDATDIKLWDFFLKVRQSWFFFFYTQLPFIEQDESSVCIVFHWCKTSSFICFCRAKSQQTNKTGFERLPRATKIPLAVVSWFCSVWVEWKLLLDDWFRGWTHFQSNTCELITVIHFYDRHVLFVLWLTWKTHFPYRWHP